MRKVIIDCDPGIDDTFALILASRDPNTKIVGLTSCFGNNDVHSTTTNLLNLKDYLKIEAPVFKGSEQPLMFTVSEYGEFHGINGLGGSTLPTATSTVEQGYAWDAIYQICKESPNEVTIITLGPLTNLAKTILKYDDFTSLVKEVHMMGGTSTIGNEGPYGEANFTHDPHAAKIVFAAGFKKTMAGLNATGTTKLNEQEILGLRNVITEFLPELIPALDHYDYVKVKYGDPGLVIHDAAAISAFLYNDYESEHLPTDIETSEGFSFGRSVIDRRPYSQSRRNAFIIKNINKKTYYEALLRTVGTG